MKSNLIIRFTIGYIIGMVISYTIMVNIPVEMFFKGFVIGNMGFFSGLWLIKDKFKSKQGEKL